MRIAVLINARMTSRRLPRKHLALIDGKPALQHLLERLQEFDPIIATGNNKNNGELWFKGFETQFADDDNIPQRHLTLARWHDYNAIVSIDGDDLFTSPQAVRDCIAALREGKSLVRTQGLPFGFNVLWGYSVPFLEACIRARPHKEPNDTGWGHIFPIKMLHLIDYDVGDTRRIHASLDYPEDLDWFRTIFATCPASIRMDDKKFTAWLREHHEL